LKIKVHNVESFPEQVRQLIEYVDNKLPQNHPLYGLKATPIVEKKPEIWILGTSNSSAYLAGEFGLPYAFAHFINYQAGGMQQALNLYIKNLKPSDRLAEPKVLAAMKVIVADTDEEAEKIAASALQFNYFLHRGKIVRIAKPETVLDYLYTPNTIREIEEVKKTYIIGSPKTVAEKVKALQKTYPIDELMAISPIYDFEKRKRSFELLKEAVGD
jgi:luciferase family oxidoreductase group 1